MNTTPSWVRRTRISGISGISVSLVVLAGCTNMSGLGGSSSLSCKAPDGVSCDSVSGVYANAVQNNLPSQRRGPAAPAAKDGSTAAGAASAASSATASSQAGVPSRPAVPIAPSAAALPLRSSARILRLWFKPWEDADRDLYDQGYVYVQIDSGQWLIEHAQRQIREAHAPLRPPPRSAASAHEPKEGAAALSSAQSSARLPAVGDLPPGLVPPASRPERTD